MKQISPISPLNEIVPENNTQPAVSTPANPAEALTPAQPSGVLPPNDNPYPTIEEVSQPPAAMNTPPAPAAAPTISSPAEARTSAQLHVTPAAATASSIYPTPLTPEERNDLRAEARKYTSAGTSISQFGIPIIVGLYSLAEFWRLIKVVGDDSLLSVFGGVNIIFSFSSYLWAGVIIGFVQTILLMYAAYKVWRGSLAGLAFISGISLMILPPVVVFFALTPSFIGEAFKNAQSAVQLCGIFGLFLMLILAWTKDRQSYSN